MKKAITIILTLIAIITTGLYSRQLKGTSVLYNDNTKKLHGEIPEDIQNLGLKPLNRLESSKQLNLVLSLPLVNQDELKHLIQQIYDPKSPEYHKYLSPHEVYQRFGPEKQDYQTVIDFARANHLLVTGIHNSRMLLEVSGSVADIENAFNVHMFEYKRPGSNDTFYAPDAEPSIDSVVPVQQIKGLNNYSLFYPNSKFSKIKSNYSARPNGGSAYGLYIGNDFRNAYAPGVSLNGSGQSVGLLQFDGYDPADISEYEQIADSNNPANVSLENIYIGGFDGKVQSQSDRGEVTLDIDMAIAMAPGLSKVVVFESPNDAKYFDIILDSMITHPEIKQFSTSWALSPDKVDPTADGYFEIMAVQGQSFFCASGDRDAYSLLSYPSNGKKLTSNPAFPESDTNITVVGGTELGMISKGTTWAYDSVWNSGFDPSDNLYWGSSGGVSTTYLIPSWQTTVSAADNNRSLIWRNIPDVALTSDSVFIIMSDTIYISEGTSCAAPLWAGFTALVNQQSVAAGGQTVGFINPAIYSIGNGARYTSDFHDVTLGNNIWPGSPVLYTAVKAYDLTTGWGTPNGQNLIDDLSGSLPAQITKGIAAPDSGSATTQFSFSVLYKSLTGQPPDSINVVVDNQSYKMTAPDSSWVNGVLFNFSSPALFSTRQHSYYFTGSVAGSVIIRFPSSGTLQFTVENGLPNAVQQVSPPNDTSGIALPVQLKWMNSAGAASYGIELSADSTFAPAIVDTTGLKDTSFTISGLNNAGTYYWRVNAANSNGTGQWSKVWNFKLSIAGINNNNNGLPVAYNLYQNYPNPFNPATLIKFALPFNSNVKIEIYNILGERVRELLNEQKPAGYYEVNFNSTGLASGVYLYLLQAYSTDGKSVYRAAKKMMLLK
jgi:subtilase family serine protease